MVKTVDITSQKQMGHFYFYDYFGKYRPISGYFTVIYRNELQKTLELKLLLLLKSVATLLCENYMFTTQLRSKVN